MARFDLMSRMYRCPETHQPLRPLEAERVGELNEAVRAGTLRSDDGGAVQQIIDDGLVREDGKFVYPIRDGVPNLLIGDRISIKNAAN